MEKVHNFLASTLTLKDLDFFELGKNWKFGLFPLFARLRPPADRLSGQVDCQANYSSDLNQTLKLALMDNLLQMPTVLVTFVKATFVRLISAIS